MFIVTQRGATTTVDTGRNKFKITWSQRYRRYQVKLDGKLQAEGDFQRCLNYCANPR
jgi:hypothetical protein